MIAPIFYDISYIANINLPRITSRQFENRSLFQILRDHYRIEIKGGDQRIKAIPATSKISRFLHLKKDQPVLHLERRMETNNPGSVSYIPLYSAILKSILYSEGFDTVINILSSDQFFMLIKKLFIVIRINLIFMAAGIRYPMNKFNF